MKKNLLKIISFFLLILMVAGVVISTISNATSFDSVDIGFVTSEAKDTSGAGNKILSMMQSLIVVFQVAATGTAIIMLIVLAIKYIMASPSDKADIKKSATIYIIGAVVLFATSGILEIIRNFAYNISATTPAVSKEE